ncbi:MULTISPECIES: ribonuclease P protein component [unclassified Synechococcus]|uniref:ribonuclease P protein component n=1 Tax=unclassified Synechococcus TaxID=2626047 RepID=UPI00006995D3|nr:MULTISPECIES: ribonuclease P protein component [unclassified Synechococcus]EAQ74477.1 bacterial ribonuclease P protein component of ribozyme [Synechococcus sp. WH 5701]MCP9826253.1 ribonuclease P protein component [Synechococcus sp. EJ6-Ellesmere]WFN60240.1 ribonuclease P protein component [Synechococcus sp. CCFWC 502]CAK6700324.1 Ribonuclease P protein component [Synechococcus sp. CBW1107]
MALPRDLRLRGDKAFDHLYRKGRRFHGTYLVLRSVVGEPSLLRPPLSQAPFQGCRCAVVVSTKVSKRSVRRNRLRRLLHGWLCEQCGHWPADSNGLWLLLSLKPGCLEASHEALLGECSELFRKAGLSP